MKKFLRSILCLMLALSVVFCFAACSSTNDDDEEDEDDLSGTYIVYKFTYDGESYTAAEMEDLLDMDLEDVGCLELKKNGTGTLTIMEESQDIEWDEDKIWPEGDEDDCIYIDIDGDKITIEIDGDEMVFKKA